jgi:CheY-like chemotaxis protein/nitrogen-specific signal transduction histidine kinase
MLLFDIACLFVTLYVLQKYATKEIYSRMHRFLPLVLGLVGVYDFYEIGWHITGEVGVFSKLEDLLLVEMVYLLTHYIVDFMGLKIPEIIQGLMFACWIIVNAWVIVMFDRPDSYRPYLLAFIIFNIVSILTFGAYAAFSKNYFTRREHRVGVALYISILLPCLALIYRIRETQVGHILLSVTLACACLMILYLIQNDLLTEPMVLLQETMYEKAELVTILFDADLCYLDANQAAHKMFPKELGIYISWKKRNLYYVEYLKALEKLPQMKKEFTWKGAYYQCKLFPVYKNGKKCGYVLSVWDITKQKQETQVMEILKKGAEDQTALKSRFLAVMSHDLRSPIHAMMGISDILLGQKTLSTKNRGMLEQIKNAGTDLLEQVDSILLYSKLESGHLELQRSGYDLKEVLENLAYLTAINLREKSVELNVSIETEYPVELIGDDRGIYHIIQNLISNAEKYTDEGEICCQIFCERIREEHRVLVTCKVKDTGCGMTEEQIGQAFDEYVTFADGIIKSGMGLGLCIVRQLAELMEGTVKAESDGKTGSTLTASFYQEYEDEEFCPPVTITKGIAMGQQVLFHSSVTPNYIYPDAWVLMADDMQVNHEVFKGLAEPWKFHIDFVTNGKQAIRKVKEKNYQMIFLDIMMPEVSGIEAAAEIHSQCTAPLIAMTADLSSGTRKRCLEKGFLDFLEKPMDISAFRKMIEENMPAEYRKLAGRNAEQTGICNYDQNRELYRRTLETFVREMRPISEALAGYMKDNLGMFRSKVHGIKGVSRQIGRYALSDSAEVMEMAAKTEHIQYIENHFDAFLQELQDTIEEAEAELACMPRQKPAAVEEEEKDTSARTTENLWKQLRDGFDTYAIAQIEESLERLAQRPLTEQERNLYRQAKDACEELEYEKGSALFREA